MRERRGTGKLGCLVTLMVMAAGVYFAVNVGEVFWNYYVFQDRMRTMAAYASMRSDGAIRNRLVALADSLDLPESAYNVHVRRVPHAIFIWADYSQHIELPGFVYELHFNPQATGTF